jgi:endonuclease YncB( thermonuclease family)
MKFRSILICLTFAFLAACQAPQYAPIDPKGDFTGRVVAIGDGDSITVLDDSRQERRVRFFAIDSPELNQAFGKQSKQHLSELIYGKTVTVEVHGRDRYERAVGKVLLDGLDINLAQIKGGYAWHYRQFENQQDWPDRVAYRDAETAARDAGIGLWAESDPEPPWRHRKEERER